MSAEKIALYEATLSRLERQVTSMEASRRKLVWVCVGCVAVAPMGLAVHWALTGALVVAGFSIWGVGSYLTLMHVIEDKNGIAEARAQLDRLRGS